MTNKHKTTKFFIGIVLIFCVLLMELLIFSNVERTKIVDVKEYLDRGFNKK